MPLDGHHMTPSAPPPPQAIFMLRSISILFSFWSHQEACGTFLNRDGTCAPFESRVLTAGPPPGKSEYYSF